MNILTESQALALVAEQLGRAAQDPLEIAIVLEAWGGVAPELSLPLAIAIAPQAISLESGTEQAATITPADRSMALTASR